MHGAASRNVIGLSGRISYLFGRLCARLPGVLYIRHVIVAVPADELPAMPKGWSARSLCFADLDGRCIDVCRDVQADRFAAGMACIGAFDRRGELAGVTWVGRNIHDEALLRVRFRLPSGAAWDGGLWIDEGRRLSRAFVAIWAGVAEWLAVEGLDETISSIADYNAASLASHRRLGARMIGGVAILRIGPVQWTMGARIGCRWLKRKSWPEISLRSGNVSES